MLAELRAAALFDGGAGAGLLPRLAAERLERGPRRAGALEDVLLLLRELLGALAALEDVFGAEVAALGEVGDALLFGEELEQRSSRTTRSPSQRSMNGVRSLAETADELTSSIGCTSSAGYLRQRSTRATIRPCSSS